MWALCRASDEIVARLLPIGESDKGGGRSGGGEGGGGKVVHEGDGGRDRGNCEGWLARARRGTSATDRIFRSVQTTSRVAASCLRRGGLVLAREARTAIFSMSPPEACEAKVTNAAKAVMASHVKVSNA